MSKKQDRIDELVKSNDKEGLIAIAEAANLDTSGTKEDIATRIVGQQIQQEKDDKKQESEDDDSDDKQPSRDEDEDEEEDTKSSPSEPAAKSKEPVNRSEPPEGVVDQTK